MHLDATQLPEEGPRVHSTTPHSAFKRVHLGEGHRLFLLISAFQQLPGEYQFEFEFEFEDSCTLDQYPPIKMF